MKRIRTIAKRDTKHQLVLVEIYVPNEVDSQGEFATPETLEKAAHDFAAGGNHNNVSIMHNGQRIDASVVESYIAKKRDPMFAEGTWVAVLKVRDPDVWAAIESGQLKGVSFEGRGHRRPATLNGASAREMYDLEIHTISLVDRPANRRSFAMTKRDTTDALTASLNEIGKALAENGRALAKLQHRLSGQEQRMEAMASGHSVQKSAANSDPDMIAYYHRKRDRLQDRLDSIMDRPDLFEDGAETAVIKSLRDIDDELYALGHEGETAGLDDAERSGFAHRGGRSDFLQASVSSFEDVLGLSHASRNITKSDEDKIDLNCLIL